MSRLITVIVPIYNVEQYLSRCVESIICQTYKNIEIILVDDGSPDKCPEMCDNWALQDERIKVVHKKNGGLSDARNVGIKLAKGEYYLLVDSDDYIVEDAIERLERYANDEDLIIGEAQIHEPNATIDRIHTNLMENYVYSGAEYSILAIKKGEWFAAACYNMYRTEFIKKNDLYFKTGILHEDNEYLPRLMLAAKTVKYIHYMFYRYMIRESSISSNKSEKHLVDLFNTYTSWKFLIDSIEEKQLKRYYSAALSKAVIHTCREYKIKDNILPSQITRLFLLKNAIGLREKIKTIVFVCARRIYINL